MTSEMHIDDKLFTKYGMVADSGKVIFDEGETGTNMFIIQSGNVKIVKKTEGKEITLAILNKGDFFGEMALVNNSRRTATAIAVGTVSLLVLDRNSFLEMIQKNGKIALSIIEKLCRRLNQTNQQLKFIAEKNKKGLFLQHLYYAFKSDEVVNNSISHVELCREISMTIEIPHETINLYLQKLKDAGIVELTSSKVTLMDEKRLAALASLNI